MKHITFEQLIFAVTKVVAYIKLVISGVNTSIDTKINDAPADGKPYVRQDNAWVEQKEAEQPTIEYATDEEVEQAINDILK